MMIDRDTERLRETFRLQKDTNENILLKNRLVSVCTLQKSSKKRRKELEKKLSIMNAMLNRQFLKRHYKDRKDRIMFFSFFEESPKNRLLHSHMILRLPKFIITNYERYKRFAREFKRLVQKFNMTYTNYKRPDNEKRRNAMRYATKDFNSKNDNFFVF